MKKRLLWVLVVTVWGSLLSQVANAEEKPICAPAGSKTGSQTESQTKSRVGAAKIAAVQGKVEAKRTTEEKWHVATRNAIYCPGDQIRVGKDSRASIILSNDTLVRLDQYSAITLTKIETEEGPSLLDLVKGIAHFISRVPRSIKVDTPFVNAAIEGTEFVVAVKDNDTTVTVFEGIVLTENENGSIRLLQNESSIAKQDQAPEKILLAKPRDTVQWALYFPPLIKADAEGNPLQQASSHLYKGRVQEASALLSGMDSNGEAKALQAIIAIVNNDKENAFNLAKAAVQLAPDSAAPHIAMSYAWQAQLNLNQALASAEQATNKAPDNAIAWARLAELQLSVGKLRVAQSSAIKATELDENNARAQTILGYAYLTQINIEQARNTFNNAIELDQNDPLPHLGLGLAMIRKNELNEGRREIEIAASLDPNNAIIRSYLGKAYYEEKRGPLDAEQFAMAKALDPNDPTPYYYDAIRKQSENDPVGALADLNKSIELNDNRAVYRSSLQLDQDEAARSAGLARIYQDLGFEQTAVNEATKSLAIDPSNHSAHRFLADTYADRQRHEIAHASELFQSKMLQPLGLTSIQPQSAFSDLDTYNFGERFGNSSSDFTNLYTREGTIASANLFSGNHNTRGYEVMAADLYENVAISAAYYSYDSDGFRENNDVSHDIFNLFMQVQATDKLSVQAEYLNRNTDKGDQDLVFDPTVYDPNLRTNIDSENSRIGFSYQSTNRHSILGSLAYSDVRDIDVITNSITFPIVATQIDTRNDHRTTRVGELQHIYKGKSVNITSGLTNINYNSDRLNTTRDIVPPFIDITTPTSIDNFDTDYSAFYSYLNWLLNSRFELTIGASYEDFERNSKTIDDINPKLGARINLSKDTVIRLATFSMVNKPDVTIKTLEPTQVSGFNQFFADSIGSKITQHNIGIDTAVSKNIKIGATSSYRDIEWPDFTTSTISFDDLKEIHSLLYLHWVVNDFASISIAADYESFENINANTVTTPRKLKTISYPLSISAFISDSTIISLTPTYVDHDYTDSSLVNQHDSFVVTDLSMVYRFPRRMGNLSFGVHNLFDEQFNYYNLNYTGENNEPRYVPSRSFLATLNITLQ